MTTLFKTIITKIVNISNHPFLFNYDNNDLTEPIIKTYLTIFLNPNFLKSKFIFFEEVYNSIFLNNDKRIEFSILFSKIQKIYYAFQKIAFIYKYKKAQIVVNTDMTMNEIIEKDKNIICIYQNNSKYLFHINDLINIINASLTNCHIFFAEPLHIKNPFNNLAFNKSTLYNIYFFIKFNTHLYPELVFKYFQSNFDLTHFLFKNEPLIRDYTINNYVMKSPKTIIYREIMLMIKRYNEARKEIDRIIIDTDFPVDKLIQIMKPYLLLYLNISYSLIEIVKINSEKELTYKLKKFQKFNPLFGKKSAILKYKTINTTNFNKSVLTTNYIFNDEHIKFNQINDFTTSHLSVDISKMIYEDEDNLLVNQNNNNNNTNNQNAFNYNDLYEDDMEDDSDDDGNEYDIQIITNNPPVHFELNNALAYQEQEEESEESEEQELDSVS